MTNVRFCLTIRFFENGVCCTADLFFKKSSIFWDIMPCSPLKVNLLFGGACPFIFRLCLPPAFTLVSCSVPSLTSKMEATCSPRTLVDFQQTTQRYVPEDRTLHNHQCENTKSYFVITCLIRIFIESAVRVYAYWYISVTLLYCVFRYTILATEK
jgi:hypothetical protein